MSEVLLVDDDPGTLCTLGTILQQAGYLVRTASLGAEALALLDRSLLDIAICDLRLSDMSGMDVLRTVSQRGLTTPFVIISECATIAETVALMRLGAVDVLEKPICEADLLRTVQTILVSDDNEKRVALKPTEREAHAAARWARAVVPIIDSPTDLRKISDWGHWIAASSGALRNWCRTAGIGARSSLVFGRMLRAVVASQGGSKPENLLDVVDSRTLSGLLRFAGMNGMRDFPNDVHDFFERQIIVRGPDLLLEVRRVLKDRCVILGSGRRLNLGGHNDPPESAGRIV